MVVAGRFLLRPMLRWIANTGLREIFIAFSLLLAVVAPKIVLLYAVSCLFGCCGRMHATQQVLSAEQANLLNAVVAATMLTTPVPMMFRKAYYGEAKRIAARFRRHDEELIARIAAHRGDDQRLVEIAKQSRADLQALLTSERGGDRQEANRGWS